MENLMIILGAATFVIVVGLVVVGLAALHKPTRDAMIEDWNRG